MKNQTVYLLFGPTGSGKSDLLFHISKKRNISLISADSVQVYKGLDIGSAKPTRDEQKLFPHHLIDIREPDEVFSVADFIENAENAIRTTLKDGRVPVISGGTAFYFKKFLYGLSQAPKSDAEIRESVQRETQEKGLEVMFEYLKKIDNVSALRINPNDKYRIQRAIEVFRQSGKPLSFFKNPTTIRNDYKFVIVGIFREKDELCKRIKLRLDKMLEKGLVEEVKGLRKKGLCLENQSMNAIGYREFFLYDSLDEIRNQIYINSVHYAKRQMTFFRSLPQVKWIDGSKLK